MNDLKSKKLFRDYMVTKAPKVFTEYFKRTTVDEGIMIEHCFHKFAEFVVNDLETSASGLHIADVSGSFLKHLELQLKYHKQNEQNRREMGDYEKAMYHRDRGGAIEDLIIKIKNDR